MSKSRKSEIVDKIMDTVQQMTDTFVFDNGIHKLAFDVYKKVERVHKSRLWTLYTSTPARYKYEVDNKERNITPSMILGSAVHTSVLEPAKFLQNFIVAPATAPDGLAWNRRLKEHKLAWAEFEKSIIDKTILTDIQKKTCDEISKSVLSHPAAKMLLERITPELSLFWTDPDSMVDLKGRPDGTVLDNGIIIDIKTCISAAPNAFKMASYKYGYHFQSAIYMDGLKACGIEPRQAIIIAVEKTPPYCVAVYDVGGDALDLGRTQYKHMLDVLKNCIKVNRWPGYDAGILTLPLPSFAGCEEYGGGGVDWDEILTNDDTEIKFEGE